MIGILVAIKSFLEIDSVVGVLGTLDAGLNIANVFSFLKSRFRKNSVEIQIIDALDESFKESCKKLGWEYDSMAAYMWLDVKTILTDTVMTKESLEKLLEILSGKRIYKSDVDVFIDCFDKSISGKPEAFRYLNQKWQRYIAEGIVLPTVIPIIESHNDFSSYYSNVKRKFTRKKTKEYADLVGDYSDEQAYIDAYIKVGDKREAVLPFLENWFCNDTFGTLLIYGEPGHGKTSLCNKAVFEYCKGNFLKNKATNILAISLNTGDNPRIIDNKMVVLDNALTWRGTKKSFSFEDCRGALLFMDGFDEFIDEAKKADIKNIVSFMKLIDEIADEYGIHIVVLSRKTAVDDWLEKATLQKKSYMLMPITTYQQNIWMEQHGDYDDYAETLQRLRNNTDMDVLLGIPFLFRLIVHSRFDETSTNVVELYDKLFNHLMMKRDIYGDELESINIGLSNLAYDIYCTDTNIAVIPKNKKDDRLIIAFYIKQSKGDEIGFYHRSFYQYFLAKFIYRGIFDLNDNEAETFIGLFAERELDKEVQEYLSLMINEKDKDTIFKNLKIMIDAFVRTEAYLNFKPRFPSEKVEKTRIGRTINIYRNVLFICAALCYLIEIPFKDTIDVFLRLFPSNNIIIYSNVGKSANLRKANLQKADLCGASLCQANLSAANLRKADLSRANLSGVDFRNADLSEANLSGADLSYANLRGANLEYANLNDADLSYTNLSGANLKGTNLNGANLRNNYYKKMIFDESNKDLIDPSAESYNTIIWS